MLVASGLLGVDVAALSGLGAQRPGRQVGRPASEVQSPLRRSWVDRNGATITRVSNRLFAGRFVAFWLSMLGLLVGLVRASDGLGSPGGTIQAAPASPVGLALLAGFGWWIGMSLSLCTASGRSPSTERSDGGSKTRSHRVRSPTRADSSASSGRRATSCASTRASRPADGVGTRRDRTDGRSPDSAPLCRRLTVTPIHARRIRTARRGRTSRRTRSSRFPS